MKNSTHKKYSTGLIMIEEPFYSIETLKQINESSNLKYVILHTDFISLNRIIKTLFIFGPINFTRTVVSVLNNMIRGGLIKKYLRNNEIKFIETNSINNETTYEFAQKHNIDFLISFNCPQIIKKRLLRLPKIYPLNIHSSLLPNYRGLFPTFHAFLQGEEKVGMSIHIMNEKFDDGEILIQSNVPVETDDNLLSLYKKSFSTVPNMLIELFVNFRKLDLTKKENSQDNSSYYSYPSFKDILNFRIMILKKRLNI